MCYFAVERAFWEARGLAFGRSLGYRNGGSGVISWGLRMFNEPDETLFA